jgi:prefoldin subunit 5
MKQWVVLVASAVFLLFSAQPGFAQSSEELKALKEEIEALKQGQKAIQKDLTEIKTLLRGRRAMPPFKEALISIDGEPFRGEKAAKLTLIEFSEYQ